MAGLLIPFSPNPTLLILVVQVLETHLVRKSVSRFLQNPQKTFFRSAGVHNFFVASGFFRALVTGCLHRWEPCQDIMQQRLQYLGCHLYNHCTIMTASRQTHVSAHVYVRLRIHVMRGGVSICPLCIVHWAVTWASKEGDARTCIAAFCEGRRYASIVITVRNISICKLWHYL